MAPDILKEVSKTIAHSKHQTDDVYRRVGERFPKVEKARDISHKLIPFTMEFEVLQEGSRAVLDLVTMGLSNREYGGLLAGPGLKIIINDSGMAQIFLDPIVGIFEDNEYVESTGTPEPIVLADIVNTGASATVDFSSLIIQYPPIVWQGLPIEYTGKMQTITDLDKTVFVTFFNDAYHQWNGGVINGGISDTGFPEGSWDYSEYQPGWANENAYCSTYNMALPSNIYKFVETVTILGVGFYAEKSPEFWIYANRTAEGGFDPPQEPTGDIAENRIPYVPSEDLVPLSNTIQNTSPSNASIVYCTTPISDVTYAHGQFTEASDFGWHIARFSDPITFKAGDFGVFGFSGQTIRNIPTSTTDPHPLGEFLPYRYDFGHMVWGNNQKGVPLRNNIIKHFSFAQYFGSNQFVNIYVESSTQSTAVGTPTLARSVGNIPINDSGWWTERITNEGFYNTEIGSAIPQYAMMLIISSAPPSGAEQSEEIPLSVNEFDEGYPGYLYGTREYMTRFPYKSGTLKVWINGVRQIVKPFLLPPISVSTEFQIEEKNFQRFMLAEEVPTLEEWERILVSYTVR